MRIDAMSSPTIATIVEMVESLPEELQGTMKPKIKYR